MTSDARKELREKVARAIYASNHCSLMPGWEGLKPGVQAAYRVNASAAIDIALEEAARATRSHHSGGCNCLYCYGREDAEAAIRALKSQP